MAPRKRTAGPPDFVGVGAQRAGTSWWFRLLQSHPGIRGTRVPRKKELHFFDPFAAVPMRAADVAAYHDWFPRRARQVCGEWTPSYMFEWWALPLLRRAAPEARLLVMLRDPIERYRSALVHVTRWSPGRRLENVASEAIAKSAYVHQLERVHEHFPAERVLVLQYERCRTETHAEYRRTCRFLGADEDHAPPEPDRPRGVSGGGVKIGLWPDLAATLHERLDEDVTRLQDLVPGLDLGLWPNFAHLARSAAAADA